MRNSRRLLSGTVRQVAEDVERLHRLGVDHVFWAMFATEPDAQLEATQRLHFASADGRQWIANRVQTCDQGPGALKWISTRRFCWRPAGLSVPSAFVLGAIGCVSPKPCTSR